MRAGPAFLEINEKVLIKGRETTDCHIMQKLIRINYDREKFLESS